MRFKIENRNVLYVPKYLKHRFSVAGATIRRTIIFHEKALTVVRAQFF